MTWYQNAQDSTICYGERPAVAGLLLYPGKKEKMETTNERAFRPRPEAERQQRTEKKTMLPSSIQLEGEHSFMTTHREDFRVEDFQPYSPLRQKTPTWEKRNMTNERALVTLYQRNFPPPLRTHRKSTPAVPLPDNLGFNPSLRCEFLTVQKETYPCWAITGDTRPQQEYTRRRDTPSSGGNKVLSPMPKTTENIPQTGSVTTYMDMKIKKKDHL
ncbi:uncharacterized protein si:dkeyp-69c1.9 isoform X3 [Clupea harengus]|uniref:Uncharacterized protein si:dkeyp-69c1.9 isoform X3 n=1 Tax=Clupea harengus TaxID=7950 RepID=A0A6P8FMB6_CLUHA|nr:uncharacterized protein si:dkeyp-69c1.9 isoform X3 [Clupea harengus]